MVYSGEAQASRQGETYRIHVETEKPCRMVRMNTGVPASASRDYALEGENVILPLKGTGDIRVCFERK